MSRSRIPRRLGLAAVILVTWLTTSATIASANVGPDDPISAVPTQTRTVVITAVDWSQLGVTAAVACLVGVAATLAVQLILHRAHRHSMAHA